MGLKQQAAQGAMWIALQGVAVRLLSTSVFFVLARLLDPDAFGLMALVGACTELVALFTQFGFSTAIVQRKELDEAHLHSAFWFGLALNLLMALTMLLGAPLMAAFYERPEMIPLLRVLSISFVISAFSGTQTAILTREMRFKTLSARNITALLVGAATGLTMALLGYGVWSLVMQQVVGSAVGVLMLWWVADWRPKWTFSLPHLRDLYSFGINVFYSNLIMYAKRHGDELLIAYFMGTSVLGYYTIALKLIKVINQYLTNSVAGVLLPTFAKLQNQPEKVRRGLYMITKYTSYASFPVFFFFIPVAPDLVPFAFGEQWNASVPLMQVMALSGLLNSVFVYNGSVIMSMNKPQWQTRLRLLDAVSNCVLLVIAAPFGVMAIAVATVTRSFLVTPLPMHYLKRLIGLDYRVYLRQFTVPLLGAVLASAAVWLADRYLMTGLDSVLVRLVLQSLLFAAVYLGCVLAWAPQEVVVIRSYAQRALQMGKKMVAPRRS